ncbi:MAG TPA: GAF domain-containing protein [Anaerolineales bacterium]|nr:GAF domain-containing protein [Anaerolineales bacterium]
MLAEDLFVSIFSAVALLLIGIGIGWSIRSSRKAGANRSDGDVDTASPAMSAEPPASADDELPFALQSLHAALSHPVDLSSLVEGALHGISYLLPFDLIELNLFDRTTGHFIPHRLCSPRASNFVADLGDDVYRLGEGYTGWLVEHRESLLLPDVGERGDVQPKVRRVAFPFKSYLGAVLTDRDEVVGTLEAAHQEAHTFNRRHQALLEAASTAIALSITNLKLHGQHQQFVDELVGITDIQGAAAWVHEPDMLLLQLSQKLAARIGVDVLGMLFYDEDSQSLIGQLPFFGTSSSIVVEDLTIPSSPENPLSTIWQTQKYWFSNAAGEEQLIDQMGLRPFMKKAEIHTLLITPLGGDDHRIGAILAGNTDAEAAFSEGDAEVLASLSRLCSPLIEASKKLSGDQAADGPEIADLAAAGAALESGVPPAEETPTGALQWAEALLRISAELSSSLDVDRVLARTLALTSELIDAAQAHVQLLSPEGDLLQLRASYGERGTSSLQADLEPQEGLPGWVMSHNQSVLIDDLSMDERWAGLESDGQEQRSAIAVPITVGDETIGSMLFTHPQAGAFALEQQKLVRAVAGQVGGAIKNAELYHVISDQAERLGSMLRSQQVEASQSRGILISIADGVIVTDSNHEIILFSPSAERILGLGSEDVVGHPVFDFIGVYGAGGKRWADAIRAWSRNPASIGRVVFLAERLELEDGRVISIHPAPIVLGDEFLGTVSIFRDISREVEVDRLKSEFVATVSHELRTPMTSIKGFVDLLLMDVSGELDDEQRRFLEIIASNTFRLEILVNDLLDISHLESGKVALTFEPLDVHLLLNEMREHVEHRSEEEDKQISFQVEAPQNLPRLRGDLERVRQILANLVENSFNFTPAGGEIRMRARHVGDQIEIDVIDNGMGISLSEQERIFERFFRGEQSLILGISGTGLGLAIVLNLVEMHGGRIWVTSDGIPGKGSTFTVSLPVVKAEDEAAGSVA